MASSLAASTIGSSATSSSLDETPSWEGIRYALRSLLFKFDIDLNNIGQTQRLQYEDFEAIFYHLFLIIDPPDTRRRFRSTYPARNQEERTRFIDNAVRVINDKQLSSQKVSPSQLRMCGGEPFRRLLASLIKSAAELEIETIKRCAPKARGLPSDSSGDNEHSEPNSLDDLLDEIGNKRHEVEGKLQEIRQAMTRLKYVAETTSKSYKIIGEKWKSLSSKVDGHVATSCDHSQIQFICKLLLARLEKANAKSKLAAQEIEKIQLPQEEANLSMTKRDKNKRLSQFVKEMRDYLSTEQSSEMDQTKIVENIQQKLIDYDNGIDGLLIAWKEEQERADENLLKQPEMQTRYRFFLNLLPQLNIIPIGDKTQSMEKKDTLRLADIEKILAEFPDPRYDDRDVLEASKIHFN